MAQEQGNALQEAPDVGSLPDSSDFFSQLDGEVNGGILESDDSSQILTDNTEKVVSEVQQEDVETLKKRYSDSSKEGKRLNTRLKELEPYLPILDEMRKDPELINHVRGYFEGGGQTPQSVTENLNLPEDFIFDADEAVSDTNSDSAKVLNSTIDKVVQKRLQNELGKQKEEDRIDSEVVAFKQKHSLNDDQWKQFKDYADSRPLSLDDILYLKQREENVPQEPRNIGVTERAAEHTKKAQIKPQSLASTGSALAQEDPDNDLFDAILGIDKNLENAFG
mgnify:CR=1 FL=1|tara:strand:- start:968 stop:1804 length:837 start_codon:yes stop_codon:yes gene_type:complete